MSKLLYESVLTRDYLAFSSIPKSDYLSTFSYVSPLIRNQFQPAINAFQSTIFALSILCATFYIGGFPSLVVFLALLILYFILSGSSSFFTSRISRSNHLINSSLLQLQTDALQDSRDIFLHREQSRFTELLAFQDSKLRKNSFILNFITTLPRYFVEAIVLLAVLSAFLITYSLDLLLSFSSYLALCLLSFQRIFPHLQQIYASLTTLAANSFVSESILSFISSSTHSCNNSIINNIPLLRSNSTHIEISDLQFSYPASTFKISIPHLQLKSQHWYKVVGTTGSGKSTFLDLALGLLSPSSGSIRASIGSSKANNLDTTYSSFIAHVPQSIFIFNRSILYNITLKNSACVSHDLNLINKILYITCLDKFVDSLPAGIESLCGDNGSNLSGGQRQRLGIARALYRQPHFMFFDESTNALDKATESLLLSRLKSELPYLMLLFITHSKSIDPSLFSNTILVDRGNVSVQ